MVKRVIADIVHSGPVRGDALKFCRSASTFRKVLTNLSEFFLVSETGLLIQTSPGFDNSASHGGPIQNGLPVRIAYRNHGKELAIDRRFVDAGNRAAGLAGW